MDTVVKSPPNPSSGFAICSFCSRQSTSVQVLCHGRCLICSRCEKNPAIGNLLLSMALQPGGSDDDMSSKITDICFYCPLCKKQLARYMTTVMTEILAESKHASYSILKSPKDLLQKDVFEEKNPIVSFLRKFKATYGETYDPWDTETHSSSRRTGGRMPSFHPSRSLSPSTGATAGGFAPLKDMTYPNREEDEEFIDRGDGAPVMPALSEQTDEQKRHDGVRKKPQLKVFIRGSEGIQKPATAINATRMPLLSLLAFIAECYAEGLINIQRGIFNESMANICIRISRKKKNSMKANDLRLKSIIDTIRSELGHSYAHVYLMGLMMGILPDTKESVRPAWTSFVTTLMVLIYMPNQFGENALRCGSLFEETDSASNQLVSEFAKNMDELKATKSISLRKASVILQFLTQNEINWRMARYSAAIIEYNGELPWQGDSIAKLVDAVMRISFHPSPVKHASKIIVTNVNVGVGKGGPKSRHTSMAGLNAFTSTSAGCISSSQAEREQEAAINMGQSDSSKRHTLLGSHGDGRKRASFFSTFRDFKEISALVASIWYNASVTSHAMPTSEESSMGLSFLATMPTADTSTIGVPEFVLVCLEAWEREEKLTREKLSRALISKNRRPAVSKSVLEDVPFDKPMRLAMTRILNWHSKTFPDAYGGIDWDDIKLRLENRELPFHVPVSLAGRTSAYLNHWAGETERRRQEREVVENIEDLLALSGPYGQVSQSVEMVEVLDPTGGEDMQPMQFEDLVMSRGLKKTASIWKSDGMDQLKREPHVHFSLDDRDVEKIPKNQRRTTISPVRVLSIAPTAVLLGRELAPGLSQSLWSPILHRQSIVNNTARSRIFSSISSPFNAARSCEAHVRIARDDTSRLVSASLEAYMILSDGTKRVERRLSDFSATERRQLQVFDRACMRLDEKHASSFSEARRSGQGWGENGSSPGEASQVSSFRSGDGDGDTITSSNHEEDHHPTYQYPPHSSPHLTSFVSLGSSSAFNPIGTVLSAPIVFKKGTVSIGGVETSISGLQAKKSKVGQSSTKSHSKRLSGKLGAARERDTASRSSKDLIVNKSAHIDEEKVGGRGGFADASGDSEDIEGNSKRPSVNTTQKYRHATKSNSSSLSPVDATNKSASHEKARALIARLNGHRIVRANPASLQYDLKSVLLLIDSSGDASTLTADVFKLLRKVELSRLNLKLSTWDALCSGIRAICKVVHMDISGCNLGDSKAAALVEAMQAGGGDAHLLHFNFRSNDISFTSPAWSSLAAFTKLRSLDFSMNRITLNIDTQQRLFVSVLGCLTSLQALSLSRNKIQDAGFSLVATLIREGAFKLHHLDVSSCFLSESSKNILLELINSKPEPAVTEGIVLDNNLFFSETIIELHRSAYYSGIIAVVDSSMKVSKFPLCYENTDVHEEYEL